MGKGSGHTDRPSLQEGFSREEYPSLQEALAMDAEGFWNRYTGDVLETHLKEHPQDHEMWQRLTNYRFAQGRVQDAQTSLYQSIDCCGGWSELTRDKLAYPAISCMLYFAELSPAYSLLQEIPEDLRDEMWGKLFSECSKKLEIEEYGDYVPWQRKNTAWWEAPQELPEEYEGKPLVRWMAGKLEGQEDGEIFISAALTDELRELHGKIRPAEGLTHIPANKWDEYCDQAYPEEGRTPYIELGYYKDDEDGKVLIRICKIEKASPALLPDPPLSRYIKDLPYA